MRHTSPSVKITLALTAFLTAVLLADLTGPGHAIDGLIAALCWGGVLLVLPPHLARRVIRIILWLSVPVAVLAVVQIGFMPRARGPFLSPNFLGGFAVMCVFLAIATRSHFSLLIGESALITSNAIIITTNVVSIALSQSRGAALALAAGSIVLLLRKEVVRSENANVRDEGRKRYNSWLLSFGVGAIAITAALLLRSGNEEARLGLWRLGWHLFTQRPLTGWGQGGVGIWGFASFYNVPLEWLVYTGILGIAAGAWLFIEMWRAASPPWRALLAAWLALGLFMFETPGTALGFMTALAMLVRPNANAYEHRHQRYQEQQIKLAQ